MINKVLICYSYYEGKEGPLPSNEATENLKFFLDNGIINDSKYLYCINVNGSYNFDFNSYLKKNKRLRLFKSNGVNAYQSYLNIFNNVGVNKYDCFIFMYDRIRGPYNLNKISNNWVKYFTDYLDEYQALISEYGTSPNGKLFKFPYITGKFLCINKKVFNIIQSNNFFKKNRYILSKEYYDNPSNHGEIKLSYLLLDNDINYVVLDTNGIKDLNLLIFYREKNWSKLFEITKELHKINDKTIINKIFWTGKIMKRIFELNDKKYIKHLSKIRKVNSLEKW